MKKAVSILATVLLAAIIVQFYLAASGAFDSAPKEESFALHRGLGNGILLTAVLLAIGAAIARFPGKLIGMSGLVAVLVLVQSLIREVSKSIADGGSDAGNYIFGLHAVNGVIIMGITIMLVRTFRQVAWKTAEPAAVSS
ncbi:DUF6220 domain-containing protein [Actinokineospora xionganensis]|uniref:Cytochrome b561 domain-containing protein n=1 Tax=Actinokineospora xionganensis TaxID=2684470 RepID=A0ABR7L4B2_9PSEU|nr:DUF6220 domain-containing protein [Actinokineospora xionganensis]MBC6447523.1 hypothetical protein [Actinokineospora xionganensis]